MTEALILSKNCISYRKSYINIGHNFRVTIKGTRFHEIAKRIFHWKYIQIFVCALELEFSLELVGNFYLLNLLSYNKLFLVGSYQMRYNNILLWYNFIFFKLPSTSTITISLYNTNAQIHTNRRNTVSQKQSTKYNSLSNTSINTFQ